MLGPQPFSMVKDVTLWGFRGGTLQAAHDPPAASANPDENSLGLMDLTRRAKNLREIASDMTMELKPPTKRWVMSFYDQRLAAKNPDLFSVNP